MQQGFTALEVAKLAGFETAVMLNYLERAAIFEPQNERKLHHGKRRSYTYRDLVVLRAINQLLKMGARPKKISSAIKTFERIRELPQDVDSLLEFSKKSSMFVVSREQVLFCESSQEIINLTQNGQFEMAFMLSVNKSMTPVAAAASEYQRHLDSGKSAAHAPVLDRITKAYALR